MLRTGVIGVGSMGRHHARVFNDISKLIGVYDVNTKMSKSIADEYGCKSFKKLGELVDEVDALSIAVPTEYHYEVAIEAAKRGKHILVEKPLSDNLNEAIKLVEFCKKAGVILAVGQIERFNPVIAELKKIISEGELGGLISISSRRLSSLPGRIKDVGVVMDLAIHDLDIITYLCKSDVKKCFHVNGKISGKHEQTSNIIMEFGNGVISSSEVSWLNPNKVREVNLSLKKGYVRADLANQKISVYKSKFDLSDNDYSNASETIEINKINLDYQEPLRLELENFLSSVTNASTPLVSGKDNLKVLEIVTEIIK